MALSEREKQLAVGAVLLAGVLAFYSWVHEPLFSRRAVAQDNSKQVAAELTRENAKLAREGDLNGRQQAVEARERTIDAWVPGKNSAVMFIWYLSQAEQRSGARVQGVALGERKTVQVRSEAVATTEGASAPPGQANQPSQTGQQAQTPPTPGDSLITSLTVVDLDLKVDARFAEHLLFNQAMEEMPLFLNMHSLTLAPAEKSTLDKVGTLVAEGKTWMAGQILKASPTLGGSYKIRLYFKSAKVGPPTDTMQFAEPTGRMDPFVMDGVDEFINALIDYFANPEGFDPNGELWPASPVPDPHQEKQLG